MKLYLDTNVYEETLKRIRFIFNEFPEVVVNVSGGKDSLVLFHLTRMVAEELGRKFYVRFIDQEIEWESTIEIIKHLMYDYQDVAIPMWFQFPIFLTNATSYTEDYLIAWDEKKKDLWMRERDEISYKENIYKSTPPRFYEAFELTLEKHFKGKKVAVLIGMRASESRKRFNAVTQGNSYKNIFWSSKRGEKKNEQFYSFFPLYDWGFDDVWYFILKNKIKYNSIYDKQFLLGIPMNKMRVSNLFHEMAVTSLSYIRAVEPKTFEKAIARLSGIHSFTMLADQILEFEQLPSVFSSWKEYRDHLMNTVVLPSKRPIFEKAFEREEKLAKKYGYPLEKLYMTQVKILFVNNYTLEKEKNLLREMSDYAYKMARRAKK